MILEIIRMRSFTVRSERIPSWASVFSLMGSSYTKVFVFWPESNQSLLRSRPRWTCREFFSSTARSFLCLFFFFFFFFYTHKSFCRSVLFSFQSFLRWSCPASLVRCVRGSPSDTCSSLAHQLCSSSSLTDRTAAADPSTTPSTSITSNSKFFVTTCNNFHRKTRRKDASLCKRETSIILQRFFARTCCSHRSFLLLLSFWNFPRAVFRRVDKIRALRRRPTRGIEVALFFARRYLFSSFLLLLNFAARKSVVTIFLLLWTLLTDADRLTRSPSWKRTSAPVPPSRIFCSGITALII